MQKRVLTFLATSFFSFKSFDGHNQDRGVLDTTEHFGSELKKLLAEESILKFYNSLDFGEQSKPEYATFRKAMIGYMNLKDQQALSKEIISIVDYNLPSNVERLWVIDLKAKTLLFHELVAHGRSNGNLWAGNFSNSPNSNASSLGFMITGETYTGKFGRALRLDGMEKGINDLVRERGVVMHGADYVSKAVAKAGRLGRSLGCPALAWDNKDKIIDTIMDGTVMFVNGPDLQYEISSLLLNAEQAFEVLASQDFEIVPADVLPGQENLMASVGQTE